MQGIVVAETGGPDRLAWSDMTEPSPGPGEIVAEVAFAGVNFIDTYLRTGLYPADLPFTPGFEGAGVVAAVGAGVEGISTGDRVAWYGPIGAYAERCSIPVAAVVPVPAGIALDVAAAVLLQGLTAHYLANDTHRLSAGDRCLVHAGSGGVGRLLIQIAKERGAFVIATAGSPEKLEIAAAAGADRVIDYSAADFGDAVEAEFGPRALDVVYDGVGRATFDRGLELLRPRGLMVAFGNASGPVAPVDPLRLSRGGSLFLTRPTLGDYIREPGSMQRRASELFASIAAGRLDVLIGSRFPLHDAADAHRALEGRTTVGKVLLVV